MNPKIANTNPKIPTISPAIAKPSKYPRIFLEMIERQIDTNAKIMPKTGILKRSIAKAPMITAATDHALLFLFFKIKQIFHFHV